jgi:UDP:flavonoid glycosyltransferase YjiC (YdhE family)
MSQRRRVLFFAEPATLAHVARPIVLARSLDAARYEVSVATGADFRSLVEGAGLEVRDLWCIGTRAYLAAVSAGRPVYPYPVLERYVADDLRVIGQARPEVIVGDFRLSLAVSARLAGIPYLAISNAYWSPFARAQFEVPVHAATHLLGVGLSDRVFGLLRPLIFAQHCAPMHRLCRKHGRPSLGFDLPGVFSEGDVTLFADVPELVPTADSGRPGRYVYLGPITWSPSGSVPQALTQHDASRALVYLSLGSSGDSQLLHHVVKAVLAAGCRVALGTATRVSIQDVQAEEVVQGLLPGNELAAMAQLVICNGGSPSVHQALQQGTPVLGIPANLDQLLNMQFVTRAGAGLSLRADQVTPGRVGQLVQRLLNETSFRESAQTVRRWFSAYNAEEGFQRALAGTESHRM